MARDELSRRPTDKDEEDRGGYGRTRSIPEADLHGDPTIPFPDEAPELDESGEGEGEAGGDAD
jgi:hypothetical protein